MFVVYMVEPESGKRDLFTTHKPVSVPGRNWNWFQVLVSPIEDVLRQTNGAGVAEVPALPHLPPSTPGLIRPFGLLLGRLVTNFPYTIVNHVYHY